MTKSNIIITQTAINYLKMSIESENNTNLIIYLSVVYPFTKDAHVNITYCKKHNLNSNDICLNIKNFQIYIDNKSNTFLKDAVIDFKNKQLLIVYKT